MDGHRRPELPALEPGVQLLETEGRAVGPLGALVVDHVLGDGGPAYWADSRGHARTGVLQRLVPGDRALDRIRIARGFTAYQHFALVQRLTDRVDDRVRLVVLPAMDAAYRADDDRTGGRELLLRSLATVTSLTREHDLPVLLTRTRDDDFAAPLAAAAARTISCERTAQGPRFVTDGFETEVYPQADGTIQTTLAFWRRVLAARRPQQARTATPSATPEVTVDGSH